MAGGKAAWVRMKTIFGLSVLPPESASIVVRAVNRAVAVGDVSRNARWQIVEWWAADYLWTQRQVAEVARGRPADPKPVVSAVSPERAFERMQALRMGDHPNAYGEAVGLLAEVLETLGYEDTTWAFDQLLHHTPSTAPGAAGTIAPPRQPPEACDLAITALERIATIDYRGPMPPAVSMAKATLRDIDRITHQPEGD